MLADRYPDDRERGNAMGIALGGLALGVLGKSTKHQLFIGKSNGSIFNINVLHIYVFV